MHKKTNKRGFFNIGTLIFGAIFLYLIITLFLYATTKHVTTYVVRKGTLSDNETVSALLLRDELLVKATDKGFINYFVADGDKASAGEDVCSIEPAVLNMSPSDQKSFLPAARRMSAEFQKSYTPSNFQSVYDYRYHLDTEALKGSGSRPEDSKGTLYQAEADGIVLYSYDGGESVTEDTLTSDAFQASRYSRKLLQKNEPVSSGEVLFRLVTSENWRAVFPISEAQYKKLSKRTSIRVRFVKDQNTETGTISFSGTAGKRYAIISFASGLIRYAGDRVTSLELLLSSVSGLKIPSTAIVQREFYRIPTSFGKVDPDTLTIGFEMEGPDGTTTTIFPDIYYDSSFDSSEESEKKKSSYYYVDKTAFKEGEVLIHPKNNKSYEIGDTGSLDGVYSTNRGYAVFRRVNILEKDKDYTLVQPNASYSLNQYDYIVQDAQNLRRKDILVSYH